MVAKYREKVDNLLADYRSAKDQFKSERDRLIASENMLDAAQEAQKIVQSTAQAIQEEIHDKIASLVTRCLEAIFDDPYEFVITFDQKRGRTEANLSFLRNELKVDPLTASGGGTVDVAAFALRLSSLMLVRPPLRRVMVIDEPFRFVSREYRPRIRSLLEQLSEELNIQFIMVTHIEELKCGKVVEIK